MELPVVAVVGPTAVGKSDLGVALAQRLGGEVVNADSMQLYRGMDIGTAKLAPHERGGIAHHLLDVWDVTEPAAVAEYQRMARELLAELIGRAVVPILVGGSGLYVRAVLDDLQFPGTDPALRARLEAELAVVGSAALHARLHTVDPVAAARILPGNGRRIVRALEVVELTGGPFLADLPEPAYVRPAVQIGLAADRTELDARIDARVDRMWEAGLVAEVRGLLPLGLREGRTAAKALGYAQAIAQLDGDLDEASARASTAAATRRFARRQQAWFGRDPRVHWLAAGAEGLVSSAERIVRTAGGPAVA
ncbi:MAG: tRNA (adenosine(37)-N6)-dimethylallyltransferase MiaA [Sporichthyaceae bacterium]